MRAYSEYDAIMTAIAVELGPKWEWRIDNPNLPQAQRTTERGHFCGFLHHTFNGLTLWVNGPYRFEHNQKIEVSTAWPYNESGERYRHVSLRDLGLIPYGESEPRINVSLTRTPRAVAGDIRRRMIDANDLPGMLEKVRAKLRERGEYADRKRALRQELADIVGKPLTERELQDRDGGSINTYGLNGGWSYGNVSVMGDDSVRIEASVSAELAKAIMTLIANRA